MYPNEENIIIVPIAKRLDIITSIEVCLISQANINYKKNGGKESFSWKIQIIYIVYPNKVNMIVMPNNKKNRGYCRYPCLSNFSDKLWLQGK